MPSTDQRIVKVIYSSLSLSLFWSVETRIKAFVSETRNSAKLICGGSINRTQEITKSLTPVSSFHTDLSGTALTIKDIIASVSDRMAHSTIFTCNRDFI